MISNDENKMLKHDLDSFMQDVTNHMSSEYDRIQLRAKEDPGTAGDQGEENWATLLRDWLPPTYQIETKGRIIGQSGSVSKQVDVLVLHPTYPKKLLDNKLYMAGGVAAAFECKVTLRKAHVEKAFENAAIVKDLFPVRLGNPYRELHSPIIFGLLAHSHSWKSPKSKPIQNIEKIVNDTDTKIVKHPRNMLDIICVADIATLVASINRTDPASKNFLQDKGEVITSYLQFDKLQNSELPFTPIGTLLPNLLIKLAWEEPSVRQIAGYFLNVLGGGAGHGVVREWDISVFSEDIRKQVLSEPPSRKPGWDEWNSYFGRPLF